MLYNLSLYIMVIAIWGSTWLSIKYQVNEVVVTQAVFYRFALAAMITQLALIAFRRYQSYPLKLHGWFVLFGFCLFCANYYLFYIVTGMGITTGLIAVMFSLITVMNIINARVFFGEKTDLPRITGIALGFIGICTVFYQDISALFTGQGMNYGLLLGVIATYLASLGNMVSKRLQYHKVDVLNANGWGMTYGAMILGVVVLLSPEPLGFSTSLSFIGNLLYLAVFGSILAFWFYLTLLGRIGSDRAAYSTLVFPMVALWLSWIFEDFVWTSETVIGFGLIFLGNLIILLKFPRKRTAALSS
ncbi:MAG: DMT family transporter [Thiolinea sp.]